MNTALKISPVAAAIRPTLKQQILLSCPCSEILYGGARGGGKSFGVLLDWLTHSETWAKHAKGILFRKSLPELEDMLSKAQTMFPAHGGEFRVQSKTWVFPNGSFLKFRYLENENDAAKYQGHEYTWVCAEEAGTWAAVKVLDLLRATMRSAAGVRLRLLLTANPGGPGHNWLKKRFIDPVPPYTVQYLAGGWTRVYIPATVEDNAPLMQNDTGYQERIKQAAPGHLLNAWLKGDWNVVAGGMVDDVWNENVHVLKPFPIPRQWRVERSFDWGSSRPFSVGWWAISDGSEIEILPGVTKTFPRGTKIRIAEWYGCKEGESNVGLKMTAKDIAREIRRREADFAFSRQVQPGPADSAIYDTVNDMNIARDMEREGVFWTPADKRPGSRKNGAETIRQLLKNSLDAPMESPGLFVFSNCRHFISLIPTIPRSDKDPDDVDTNAEDHIWDETRYMVSRGETELSVQRIKGI